MNINVISGLLLRVFFFRTELSTDHDDNILGIAYTVCSAVSKKKREKVRALALIGLVRLRAEL